jgi:hypothetical protein
VDSLLTTRIERITDFREFLKMENDWDALLKKSQHDLVFLSFPFIKTEWENAGWEFPEEKKLTPFILVAKENDKIIGLFPFIKEQKKVYGIPLTVIRMLGHSYLDRSDMIILDKPRTVVDEVLRYLIINEPSWNLLFMQNIPVTSSFVEHAAAFYRNKKFKLGIKPGYLSPYVEKNISWGDYVKSRSDNFHKRLKNKTNRLTKNIGEITARLYSSSSEIKTALQIAFEIDSKSWKGEEGTAISSTLRAKKYWRALSDYLAKRGLVKIWILWAGDKAIAFEYAVVHAKKVYSMKWSYDKDYHQYSPGLLLKYKAMEFYWHSDAIEVDLLGVSDSFKEQWTDKKNRHYNIYLFNDTSYSQIAYFIIFKIIKLASKLNTIIRK